VSLKKNLSVRLLGCGILTEIFYLLFAFLNKNGNIPLYMFIYFETFILFFFSYFLILKKIFEHEPADSSQGSLIFIYDKLLKILQLDPNEKGKLKMPLLIILFGIVFRITLLPTSITTSDDVHRYLWEGKVIVNGNNPFTTPPNDSCLFHLHDDNFGKVTFKHLPAIYPPLSQIVFAVTYFAAGNSIVFLKIIYLVFELITLIFLLKILILKGKNPKLILLYAWLPLPIMEYFINAHLDPIGIAFLVTFVYYFEKNKLGISSVLLAFAFLTKLLALFILPLIIKKLGIKKTLIFYLIFLLTCLIFYLPFISRNLDVLAGLFRYLEHWEFNGSIYNIIKVIFSRGDIARTVCAVLLSLSVIIISFKYNDFINGIFGIFLCILIFSTTLYPWYLGWIASLNVITGFASVSSLFFTINLSNFTPLAEKWREYTIVLFIEYIPFYGLLIYDLWKRKVGNRDGNYE
jgi:alpha-1,6-mannosyltransferase